MATPRGTHLGAEGCSLRPATAITDTEDFDTIMSKSESVAAAQRFGEIVNSGEFDKFAEVVAPNSVDHDPAPGQAPGPGGYMAFFSTMRKAFPDMKVVVEHLVADGDDVAFAYTLTGSHKGDFQGVAPTGKPIKIRGMQIARFENGRMVERWGSSDELGLLKQIGAK
jgi:steroid delta-isomerase-like uncharacterized protein